MPFSPAALQFEWRSRAPLPEPRAALLQANVDGKLLAAGGTHWKDGKKQWSSRCDLFDPRTNSWTPCAALPATRGDSPALEVDGEFLFFGGTSDGRVLDDVLAFDGKRWYDRPDMRLPAPRSYCQVALVERQIYLFGGLEKAGEIATGRRNVWMWNLDYPDVGWQQVSQMPEPTRSLYAFAVLHGKAFLFGGVVGDDKSFHNIAESWSYDFAKKKWEALPAVPTATRAWAGVVVDETVVIVGGYTDTFARTIITFDPKSHQFASLGNLPRGLADIRVTLINGSLYVTGGESGPKIRSDETLQGTT